MRDAPGAPRSPASRCTSDLAAHIAGASRGQAEGLRRAAAGITDVALLDPAAQREPRDLLTALKDGQDRLLSALREMPAQALDGAVPLPFGLLPAAVALQIVPLEYGFHRNDVEWALGNPVPLSDDMSSTLLDIMPGLLPMLAAGSPVSKAGVTPSSQVSYRLLAPSARLFAAYAQDEWSITPDDGLTTATCEISGDDSTVALFAMGRIGANHPGITTSNPAAASAFK